MKRFPSIKIVWNNSPAKGIMIQRNIGDAIYERKVKLSGLLSSTEACKLLKITLVYLYRLVEEGKLTHKKAYGITESWWPDEKKMLTIANQVGQLTDREFKQALQIGQENPKEPVDKVIEEAKKPSPVIRLALVMSKEMADRLQARADKLSAKLGHSVTMSDLILQTIEKFLGEGG